MVCTRHLTLALPIQWQSCGIPLVSQFFAEKNKVIWRLWVGPYSEKLWPRVWNAFSRPGSQFFTLETSQPANNVIYTLINLVFRIAGIWFQKKKINPRCLKLFFWLTIINQRIVCNEIKRIKIFSPVTGFQFQLFARLEFLMCQKCTFLISTEI